MVDAIDYSYGCCNKQTEIKEIDVMSFIYVRKITDWPDPVIEKWDELFFMDWRKFRNEMRIIALSNWQIPYTYGERLCDRCQSTIYKTEIDQGEFLIPSDEYDWFNPALQEILYQVDPEVDFVRWRVLINSTLNKRQCYEWKRNRVCCNGYAFRARVLTTELMDDFIASKTANNCSLNVIEIAETLSCHNEFLGERDLLLNCDLSLTSMPYGVREDQGPEWAHQYIKQLDDLIQGAI